MAEGADAVIFALDAGATNTRAIVVDATGSVLWQGASGNASLTRAGMEHAADVVASLWYEACENGEDLPARLSAIAGGFAGGEIAFYPDGLCRTPYQGVLTTALRGEPAAHAHS